MISLLLGFLFSILLFVLKIVLRVVVKSLSVVLNRVTNKLGDLAKQTGVSDVSNEVKKVGKFTGRLTNLSLKVSVVALKSLITVLGVIIHVLTVITTGIVTILATIGLPICVIFLVVLISISAVVSTMGDISPKKKQSGYSTQIGVSSYNYMDIDWSQDFTEVLNSIEASYGKNDRDVAEYIIICMNTQQNLEETKVPITGYCIGNIVVESGGSANLMGGASGHPTNDYTLRNAEEGIMWEHAAGDGVGYPRADGLFQIITSGWVGYNELYSEQSSKLTPQIDKDTTWYRLRYYCPTVAYGTLKKYNGIVNSSDYEFTNLDGKSAISHAFELLGIEETDGRHSYLKNACMASYAYASLVKECYNDTAEDARHNLATNIAMFVLAYCETYLSYDSVSDTYLYTEASTNLSKSVVANRCGSGVNLSFSNSVCQSVYGTTGRGNFSEEMLKKGDYGVLDVDGNLYDGTICGYLYSLFPDSAVEFFEDTKEDTIDHMSNTVYSARCYYDISMLLVDNYMLETVVTLLNLKTTSISSDWMKAYQDMGSWYSNNVNTYQDAQDNTCATGHRRLYPCPLLNGTQVGDDCSAFVAACLTYAGITKDSAGAWLLTASYFQPDSGKPIVNDLMASGFTWIPYSSSFTPQAGDILLMQGHIEIIGGYSGAEVYCYTWGNNNSIANGRGLPMVWKDWSGYVSYWFRVGHDIIGCWRKSSG